MVASKTLLRLILDWLHASLPFLLFALLDDLVFVMIVGGNAVGVDSRSVGGIGVGLTLFIFEVH